MTPALGERLSGFVYAHPRVVVGVSAALVGFAAFNLVGSVALYLRSLELCGEIQRHTSEALGG